MLSAWIVLPLWFFWMKRWCDFNSWVKDKNSHERVRIWRLTECCFKWAGSVVQVLFLSDVIGRGKYKRGKQVWKDEYSFLLSTSVVQTQRKNGNQICFLGIQVSATSPVLTSGCHGMNKEWRSHKSYKTSHFLSRWRVICNSEFQKKYFQVSNFHFKQNFPSVFPFSFSFFLPALPPLPHFLNFPCIKRKCFKLILLNIPHK